LWEVEMPPHAQMIKNISLKLGSVSAVYNAGAAVALLLRPSNDDFKILIVKRVENPSDPWSGQMAFPGGKRNLKDQNLKQTVIRETLEETNINLAHSCRFLGVLEKTRSTVQPELHVAPFVILLEQKPIIKLNEELVGFFCRNAFWRSLSLCHRRKRYLGFNL
jgi:8-oxo-dGTP pyrophosphatase MutT (NUDIX family)